MRDMNTEPESDCEVDFWLDPDLTLWFSIRCPKCRTVHEHKAEALPKGRVIACDCGARLEIGDDDFERSQQELRNASNG
jgi:hypothetical protein